MLASLIACDPAQAAVGASAGGGGEGRADDFGLQVLQLTLLALWVGASVFIILIARLWKTTPDAAGLKRGRERRLARLADPASGPVLIITAIGAVIAMRLGAESAMGLLGVVSHERAELPGIAAAILGSTAGIVLVAAFAAVLHPAPGLLALGGGPATLLRDTLRGAGWLLITLPIVIATGFAIRIGLDLLSDTPVSEIAHDTLELLVSATRDQSWWLTVVGVTILVPVAEEVLFRGLLQSGVRAFTKAAWPAILITTIIFTLMHLGSVPWYALPSLTLLAIMLGVLYERTGRLWPCIVLHALFNGANVALAATQLGPPA